MVDYTILLAYVGAIILFLATPGPVAVMVVNTSIRHGKSAAIKSIIGTNLASLVLMAASMLIIQGVLAISQMAMLWLTLLGSLYLLYFAVQVLKQSTQAQPSAPSSVKSLKDGLIVGLSNPKDILFFIAFFPMFFQIAEEKWLAIALLVGIWVLLDYAILMMYALCFSAIKQPKVIQLVNKLSAWVLMMIGVYAAVMSAFKLYTGITMTKA